MTPTSRQTQITWRSAVSLYANPRKDRTFDIVTNKWPNRPPGSRYQFVYNLAVEANRQLNNAFGYGDWGHVNKDLNPFLDQFNAEKDAAKHEPDSTIWFCWTDQEGSPTTQTDFGMTSYNAMYGVVDHYVTICFFAT